MTKRRDVGRWMLWLCVLAGPVTAQAPSSRDDAKVLLLELRKRVMQTVERLPKYLCTETVDRSTFQPEADSESRSCDDLASQRKKASWKIRKDTSDRLRLDVAVSGDSEMYSWVGEDRFQDRSLAELVRGGATSTGMFASFLGSIFGTNAATFSYNGEVTAGGRVLAEYGFHVPVGKSNYRIGNKLHHAIVGYDGTFLVEANALELVGLTIHADQLPPELNSCESTTTLDYGTLRLHDSEFLIPKEAHWHVVNSDGTELDNRSVFSACHEFLGKSKLSFDEGFDTPHGDIQKTVLKGAGMPAGLSFTLALTKPIETATAAAGDPFWAKSTRAIRGKDHRILAPRGAAITGRIVRIQRRYGPQSESLTVGVKLETIEVNGVPQPCAAKLESIVKRRQKLLDALVIREDLGSFDRMSDPEDPAVGFLQFEDVTKDYVIHRGFELRGITAAK